MRCWWLIDSQRKSAIMSRRKQSNPKPHKPGEDSEWTTNEEGVGPTASDTTDKVCGDVDKVIQHQQQQQNPPPSSPPHSITSEPGESLPAADPAPRGLRLNPKLATDPGRRRLPPADEPPLLQIFSQQQQQQQQQQPMVVASSSSSSASSSSSSSTSSSVVPEPLGHNAITLNSAARTVQKFFCTPCGIRFSSLSTLDAHQTFYCSRRLKKDLETDDPKGPVVIDSDEMGLCNDSDSRPSSVEPSAKTIRTGKQYKCPHCSYSADKKVSLNRHMRMHSISPVSVQSLPCLLQPDAAADQSVDRYCQNCDIRFSNLRTYQAHKTHYCSTRHVVKPTPTSSPMSNNNNNNNNNNNSINSIPSPTSVAPTHLALPTNPVIVVPYTFVQNASIISAITADGGLSPPTDTACIVLPNGALQPIAQARMPVNFNVIANNAPPTDQRDSSQSPPEKSYSPPKKTDVKVNQEPKRPVAQPSSPLDLRLRRGAICPRDVCSTDGEEEKENRRSADNVTDAEDIVCAPSIPCMIMQSPSSSPPSTGHKTQQQQQLRAGSAAQPSMNGVVQKPPRTPAVDPFVNNGGDFSVSNLLKYSGNVENVKQEFSGNDAPTVAGRHVHKYNSVHKPPGPSAVGAVLSPVIVQHGDLVNHHPAVLHYLPPEMSVRLHPANPVTEIGGGAVQGHPIAHQFFLKQVPSKCESCNIVFCKYENFLAHKKHYCASRPVPPLQQNVVVVDVDDAADCKTSPEGSPGPAGKPPSVCSPRSSKDSVSPTPVQLKPPIAQFVCPTCGVKFSSFDNLSTHQTYYCPNRLTAVGSGNQDPAAVQTDKSLSKCCPKCKLTVDGNHQNHQCQAVVNCWKCPVCGVVCSSASAAQKHLDTHNGIKAFVCTICKYKGNTLRGLRTHIRMHFNKRMIPDLMEEDYVSYVMDENHPAAAADGRAGKSPPAAAAGSSDRVVKTVVVTGREDDERPPPPPPPSEEQLLVRIKQEPQQNGAVADDHDPQSSADGGGGDEAVGLLQRRATTAKYCKACDISFKYLSTFVAHKKYYCRNSAAYNKTCNAETVAAAVTS